MKTHAVDVTKLVSVWAAWFWAINWNEVAGFLSCIFTMLLILEKAGVLNPIKSWVSRLISRFRKPVAPIIPGRTPQDE